MQIQSKKKISTIVNANSSALNAIEYAQFIAFAPVVFQATISLRDLGILQSLQEGPKEGQTVEEIAQNVSLSIYGTRVLLESGLGAGIVHREAKKYTLSKTGYFILNDNLTRVNMDFTQDVCYESMFYLKDSIKNGKPEGLKVFGECNTIYEVLSTLPKKAKESWFAFDHYYSDDAFPLVLPMVFKDKPKKLYDIGGNTGKWTTKCIEYDSDVQMTFVDLPGQVGLAKENFAFHTEKERVTFFETNILDPDIALPKGADGIWMSQFLDCFSEDEIVGILKKCYDALNENGVVYILELFWDHQKFDAASFSLQQTSLYFTAIANGNSQMYESEIFFECVKKAGFEVEECVKNLGQGHTFLKCVKTNK